MNDRQKKLIYLITLKGRPLSEEEICDFYSENVRKKCGADLLIWDKENGGTKKVDTEYRYWEIKERAYAFYYRAIGRAFQDGVLALNLIKDA
jgi:hypothetical protein